MNAAHLRVGRLLRSPLPWLLLALPLGGYVLYRILQATHGELAVPLDDAFIHFQYARALLAGHPFVYTPGATPVAGATSLLWPLLLAPFQALGLAGSLTILPAWLLGWLALALSAYETFRLARGMSTPLPAALAGLLQLGFAGNVWLAASGMEATWLAWAMARAARRSAEWAEGEPTVTRAELWALALMAPLFRPEGALASLVVFASLWLFGRGRRLAALPALLLATTPWLINWLGTGSGLTTARVKWLLYNPYLNASQLLHTIGSNLDYLVGVLLNGEGQGALFLPRGSSIMALLGLVALLQIARRREQRFRALGVCGLALAMALPTSYESFLEGRLRYLWPFSWAWFVGIAALLHAAEIALTRFGRARVLVPATLGALTLAAVAAKLPAAAADLATSASGILNQQVWLGKWAARALPADARLGVNDTGAIAYYSGRRVFDVVGLTTAGEARYWAAGPGSRFEHYEHLPRAQLPTHFIVYPGWFGLDDLLGRCLVERTVTGASVLGGTSMSACEADYRALETGARPAIPIEQALLDELDVADLESEAAHAYRLPPARRAANQLYVHQNMADGGRAERSRDTFELQLEPSGKLVARVIVDAPLVLRVQASGEPVGEVSLTSRGWHEVELGVPSRIGAGRQRVEVSASRGEPLTALHYWSYRAGSP